MKRRLVASGSYQGIFCSACATTPAAGAASRASGDAFKTAGMIIAPCKMKTLSGIVNSRVDRLLMRAVDAVLKQHRTLAPMLRESPFDLGRRCLPHEAAQLGALIAPPAPAFYNRPQTLDGAINHSVGRVLDLFGIETDLVKC